MIAVYVDAALIPVLVLMWRKMPHVQPYRRRMEIAVFFSTCFLITSFACAIVAAHSR